MIRGESERSASEHEQNASYVLGYNTCSYCHEAHAVFALVNRIKKNRVESLVNNLDSTRVDQRIKPILDYVKHLTLTPSRMVEADAQVDDETEQTETVGWFFHMPEETP